MLNKAKKNVIYKIYCKNCDASGKQGEKTRISKHCNDIWRHTSDHSVITEYRLDLNYDFDWEGTEILNQERFLYKWCVSEMLHIQLQKNSLNLQSDIEFLHHSYISIFNNLNCAPFLFLLFLSNNLTYIGNIVRFTY